MVTPGAGRPSRAGSPTVSDQTPQCWEFSLGIWPLWDQTTLRSVPQRMAWVRVEGGEQLAKASGSDRGVSKRSRGTGPLAHPTAWHDKTTGAVARHRGIRSLCEPAGGLWRRWGRLRWRRRWRWRVDHSYDDRRFDHDDDNGHNNYDECGNHNVVGRFLQAAPGCRGPGLHRTSRARPAW
jgi:hypothetical protein